MAEACLEDNELMSDDIQKSPEVQAPFCDPCKEEDNHAVALGFCVDCNDYLCSECLSSHKRSKPSRNHIIKDKFDMPPRKPKEDIVLEYCQMHKDNAVKLFCKSHNITLCDLCKLAEHRKCDEVYTIDECSENVFTSAEYIQAKGRLSKLKELFENCSKDTEENVLKVENYHTSALKELTKALSTVRNGDLDLMKSLDIACKTSASTIASILANLDALEEQGKSAKAFLEQKKADVQYKVLQDTLTSVQKDNHITKYRFVTESISTVVGQIVKPISNIGVFNIKTTTDTEKCSITGLDKLKPDKLVIADRKNTKIKVFDITTKRVISELKVEGEIWDLVTVDEKTIAVTNYRSKKLSIIKYTDRLKLSKVNEKREFGYVQGITYDNHSLIISYYNPQKIQILRAEGTVLNTIDDEDNNGTTRFGDVNYIAISLCKDFLYLADETENKVIRMTKDGTVLSTFQHENLTNPRGITTGIEGQVYVCSMGSNMIFEITSDLSKGWIILDEKHDISKPHSIVCSREHSVLYIGSEGKDEIQVFFV